MKLSGIEFDAFASGQVGSKLWLCEQLEEHYPKTEEPTVWILGGWYGMAAFLLFSRNRMSLKKIRSFDQDPNCERIADLVNDLWNWKPMWKFKAFTQNVNELTYEASEKFESEAPDIVINTSCEHMDSHQWFENIPQGTFVVAQANDMPHDDHLFQIHHEDELLKMFPLSRVAYNGSLYFDYKAPDDFTRYMIMGWK